MGEAGEWLHAWCVQYGFARRYAERVCARAVPAGVREWQCEGCVAAQADEEEAAPGGAGSGAPRECPECGVMTEKTFGCDHISCPCGAHWCSACGEREEDSIYGHMAKVHGGLWASEWVDD